MYRRDYILHLIERFGRVLRGIRDAILRRHAEPAEMRAQIAEIAREAGLDLTIARRLDPASLLLWLAPTSDFDADRLWLVAELLYLEGLDTRLQAEESGRAELERALTLFSYLPPEWRPTPELATAGERAAEIQQLLHSATS